MPPIYHYTFIKWYYKKSKQSLRSILHKCSPHTPMFAGAKNDMIYSHSPILKNDFPQYITTIDSDRIFYVLTTIPIPVFKSRPHLIQLKRMTKLPQVHSCYWFKYWLNNTNSKIQLQHTLTCQFYCKIRHQKQLNRK